MEAEGATKAEAYAILRQRAKGSSDPFSAKMPARATFYSWLAKAESAGPLSLKAFLDQPRPGRPRVELARPIRDAIVAGIRKGIHASNSRLFRWVVETFGDDAPSRHVFDRFMAELDPAVVSAAHHGSKAPRLQHETHRGGRARRAAVRVPPRSVPAGPDPRVLRRGSLGAQWARRS